MFWLTDTALEPWEGSRLVLRDASAAEGILPVVSDRLLLFFALACVLLLILFFRRFVEGVSGAFRVSLSHSRAMEAFNNKRELTSIIISFLLTVPLYSLTCSVSGLAGLNGWWVLVLLASFFALRHVVYFLTGWLTDRREPFKLLEYTSFGFFLLVMALSLPALGAVILFPDIEKNSVRIYLVGVFLAGIAVFFWRSRKIFALSGFSSFFWFLYLCSLEFLPICVAVKVLMSNGD